MKTWQKRLLIAAIVLLGSAAAVVAVFSFDLPYTLEP